MWDSLLSSLALFFREAWVFLAIGIGVAWLTFLAGWATLRRRKRAAKAETAAIPGDKASSSERRSANRRGGSSIEIEMVDPAKEKVPVRGWVVDRSVGGLRLMSCQQAPVGSVWNARPFNAPKSTPWIRVEVRNCFREGAEWAVCCQFVKSPTYSELLLFG